MFRSKEEQFDFYWKEIFDGLAYNPIEFNTYRFDQTMSLPGKVNKLYELFKVLALNNQEVMDYLKEFVETFDRKLYETIDDILSKWLEDGILTELIRNAINEEVVEARNDYSTLKERLDSEKTDVNTQLSQTNEQLAQTNEQLAQTVQLVKSKRINVLEFGAKTDGTNNLTSFQTLSDHVNNLPIDDVSVEIEFPRGEFVYSGGLDFKRPVKLIGVLGTVLNYTGTGKAIEFGKTDLTLSTYDSGIYTISDIAFTGGRSMTHGIFFNNFLTMTRLNNVRLENFGNPNAFGIWYNGNNWDSVMFQCEWYSNINTKQNWVRVYNNGINSTRLRVLYCLGTNQSNSRGFGIWLDGANNEISHSKIEGFAPNVRVGALAIQARILDTYFETTDNGGCIQYGGAEGESGTGNYTVGLQVIGCFANMHNTDFIGTNSYFLEPTTELSALQNAKVERNFIASTDREIVKQNSLGSQSGNEASGNTGNFTAINLNGSGWGGNQGVAPTFENKKDTSLYMALKTGNTSNQYMGINFLGYNNTSLATLQWGANFVDIINKDKIGIRIDSSGIPYAPQGMYKLLKQVESSVAITGSIFEDTDGKLKYKNLAGTVTDLTL